MYMLTHTGAKYFSTGMLPTRIAGMHELGFLTEEKKKKEGERRKESDLHDYRAITENHFYLCYQPYSQALLPNSNLEIYNVIIITVVHPAYFGNLQHIYYGSP